MFTQWLIWLFWVMLEQQQQLISAISTSRLRRGCALQEDNLAPRLESKTESPKVACFHAIFDLCLVFGGTLAHAPFSLSSLFPPRLPSSLPLPFHSFLRLLVFFPLLLFPSISLSPFGFFVYFFSTWGLSGTENAPHTGNNTSNRALNLRRGVKQKLSPLTPLFFSSMLRGQRSAAYYFSTYQPLWQDHIDCGLLE